MFWNLCHKAPNLCQALSKKGNSSIFMKTVGKRSHELWGQIEHITANSGNAQGICCLKKTLFY